MLVVAKSKQEPMDAALLAQHFIQASRRAMDTGGRWRTALIVTGSRQQLAMMTECVYAKFLHKFPTKTITFFPSTITFLSGTITFFLRLARTGHPILSSTVDR